MRKNQSTQIYCVVVFLAALFLSGCSTDWMADYAYKGPKSKVAHVEIHCEWILTCIAGGGNAIFFEKVDGMDPEYISKHGSEGDGQVIALPPGEHKLVFLMRTYEVLGKEKTEEGIEYEYTKKDRLIEKTITVKPGQIYHATITKNDYAKQGLTDDFYLNGIALLHVYDISITLIETMPYNIEGRYRYYNM